MEYFRRFLGWALVVTFGLATFLPLFPSPRVSKSPLASESGAGVRELISGHVKKAIELNGKIWALLDEGDLRLVHKLNEKIPVVEPIDRPFLFPIDDILHDATGNSRYIVAYSAQEGRVILFDGTKAKPQEGPVCTEFFPSHYPECRSDEKNPCCGTENFVSEIWLEGESVWVRYRDSRSVHRLEVNAQGQLVSTSQKIDLDTSVKVSQLSDDLKKEFSSFEFWSFGIVAGEFVGLFDGGLVVGATDLDQDWLEQLHFYDLEDLGFKEEEHALVDGGLIFNQHSEIPIVAIRGGIRLEALSGTAVDFFGPVAFLMQDRSSTEAMKPTLKPVRGPFTRGDYSAIVPVKPNGFPFIAGKVAATGVPFLAARVGAIELPNGETIELGDSVPTPNTLFPLEREIVRGGQRFTSGELLVGTSAEGIVRVLLENDGRVESHREVPVRQGSRIGSVSGIADLANSRIIWSDKGLFEYFPDLTLTVDFKAFPYFRGVYLIRDDPSATFHAHYNGSPAQDDVRLVMLAPFEMECPLEPQGEFLFGCCRLADHELAEFFELKFYVKDLYGNESDIQTYPVAFVGSVFSSAQRWGYRLLGAFSVIWVFSQFLCFRYAFKAVSFLFAAGEQFGISLLRILVAVPGVVSIFEYHYRRHVGRQVERPELSPECGDALVRRLKLRRRLPLLASLKRAQSLQEALSRTRGAGRSWWRRVRVSLGRARKRSHITLIRCPAGTIDERSAFAFHEILRRGPELPIYFPVKIRPDVLYSGIHDGKPLTSYLRSVAQEQIENFGFLSSGAADVVLDSTNCCIVVRLSGPLEGVKSLQDLLTLSGSVARTVLFVEDEEGTKSIAASE